MFNQRLLLRILLWSLGIAAMVGAAGVLFAQTSVAGRVGGSLVLVAVCCALMMLVTRGKNNPAASRAMMLASVLIVTEFLLTMSLIWGIADTIDEQIAITIASIAGAGLPAIVFARLLHRPLCRLAAIFGLLLSAAVLTLWMIGTWGSFTDSSYWMWFGYGTAVGTQGLLAVVAMIGFGHDRWHWRWIGVGAACTAVVILIQYLTVDNFPNEPLDAIIAMAFIVAYANLALRAPLKENQRWIIYASIAAVVATSAFLNLALRQTQAYSSIANGPPGLERLASASGILASCGSMAIVILIRLNRRTAPPDRPAGQSFKLTELVVVCPVCEKKQSIIDGASACPGCGLIIHARAEEPCCAACGYSLLMLKSDRCPECGAARMNIAMSTVA